MISSKKPTAKETTVIKQSPASSDSQKNEFRKVKIKISKAYHYKSDNEMDKDATMDNVPEITTLTPTRMAASPPTTVIVIDSPSREQANNNKLYYENEMKTQNVITRYTPPTSSILENILLRNRIDTNNNENQSQMKASPPPTSPTEMAYSYKKSHR